MCNFANDMGKKELIQLFGDKKVRTSWDPEQEKWYFSIVDVCGVLTDQPDYDGAKNYWKVLKFRLKAEGNESVTNCNQLKMVSPKDGKKYKTDVADMEQMFRLIESIPSKKAEPFKQWMAKVAAQRIDQMQDPELNFELTRRTLIVSLLYMHKFNKADQKAIAGSSYHGLYQYHR